MARAVCEPGLTITAPSNRCTVNDLWDRDIDRRVARTKSRPLARGAVSAGQAMAWLGVQLGVGAAVLLTLSPAAVTLGAASLGLVAVYPLAKRVSRWPQCVLGLTFNWGALMGLAATHGDAMPWSAVLPLYAGGFWWTMMCVLHTPSVAPSLALSSLQ